LNQQALAFQMPLKIKHNTISQSHKNRILIESPHRIPGVLLAHAAKITHKLAM